MLDGSKFVFLNSSNFHLFPSLVFGEGCVAEVNPDIKTKLRYINNDFENYSKHYGWTLCSPEVIGTLSTRQKERAIKASKKRQSVKINQSGAREESLCELTCGDMIQERFQQQTYATDNSCVWLSTALVINSIDNNEGDKLINAFKTNPISFDWLNISPKGGKNNI